MKEGRRPERTYGASVQAVAAYPVVLAFARESVAAGALMRNRRDLRKQIMNPDPTALQVTNNEQESRYETYVNGLRAEIVYQQAGDRIALVHTEVPEALEGHGIAAQLARFALDDARSRHLLVIPLCPYVAAYIARHPAYLDLVPPEEQRRLHGRHT
jgi:predicted GNAT family acetyltransferase